MTATELLRLVVARLEQGGVSYALGGSVAAMLGLSPELIDRSLVEELVDRFGLREEWGPIQ